MVLSCFSGEMAERGVLFSLLLLIIVLVIIVVVAFSSFFCVPFFLLFYFTTLLFIMLLWCCSSSSSNNNFIDLLSSYFIYSYSPIPALSGRLCGERPTAAHETSSPARSPDAPPTPFIVENKRHGRDRW